jgi:cell wall-associated NlpC family hydrolase
MRCAGAPIVVLVLACAAVAGCGSAAGSAAGSPHRVAAWTIQAPYFAPPEPGAPVRAPAASPHRRATPAKAPAAAPAEAATDDTGAPTDAEVRAELKSAFGKDSARSIDTAGLSPNGLAIPPPTAPNKLVAIIQAANAVARKPYVYGGGHGRFAGEIFSDSAYDCSGSVSYALAAAGLLDSPMDSSSLARFGKPGPGKWVTIFANGGHAWMTVAGLRFDTSGRDRSGSRWQSDGRGTAGFTVRHPPGL